MSYAPAPETSLPTWPDALAVADRSIPETLDVQQL